MDIVAKSRFLKISPKKARLVSDSIKKMSPEKALSALKFNEKAIAQPLSKLIASAIANAKNNFGLSIPDLSFKSIQIGPGPTYKRYRAASRSRVHPIAKRTANITIILQGENIKKATQLEQQIADNLKKIETQQVSKKESEETKKREEGTR